MQKINQLVKTFGRNREIDTETASQTDEMPNVRRKTETLLVSLGWTKTLLPSADLLSKGNTSTFYMLQLNV